MTEWVQQRDGSREPFDADRICRTLFTAGERIGRPDAFLAREMTDGILHFLAEDLADPTPTVEDIRELVIKTVRELGHPRLANSYEELTAARAVLPRPPRPQTFPPEILSAHAEGLLVLCDLDHPDLLAARVFPWPRSADNLPASLERFASGTAGVVLDGPEFWLASVGQTPEWLRGQLANVLRASPRSVVLNLNLAVPPHTVEPIASGPLFQPPLESADGITDLSHRFLVGNRVPGERLVWHLRVGNVQSNTLRAVVDRLVSGANVEFVLDRPRRGLHLAEGVDREEPALLLRVGVRLPRLLGPQGQEPGVDTLLQKVSTLARLALSAGINKRSHLRRVTRAEFNEGFLLDRARLQVVPLGLDVVVERMTGRPLSHGGTAVELGRRILRALRDTLTQDGRRLQLATLLDDPPPGMFPPEDLPGLEIPGKNVEPARRIRAGSLLQEITDRGLVSFALPTNTGEAGATALRLLEQVAGVSGIDRVRFHRGEMSR